MARAGTTLRLTLTNLATLLGSTFAALVHTHAESDVTSLVSDLAGKASTTHATTHKTGGADPIALDTLAAPTDVTTLNVTSTAHGLAPKSGADATTFLNGAATPAYAAVKDSDLATTDVTTNNVSSTKHGFAPKSGASATTFLNGAATPAYATVKESDLAFTDVTTNNASTTAHGFLKKLSNVASEYMDGTGNFSTPAGGSGAPTTAQYVTLATDAGLSAERTLAVGTAGAGLSLTDAGANGAVTIAIANEQWGPCTADTTVNNSTTLVNITGMTFTIGASATEIWQFEAQLYTVAASNTADWKFGLTVPASATYAFGFHSPTAGAGGDGWGADTGVTQIALPTTTLPMGSGAVTGGVFIRGFVLGGGTGGTVQLQFAQNTLTVSNNTIKKGGLLIARKSIA